MQSPVEDASARDLALGVTDILLEARTALQYWEGRKADEVCSRDLGSLLYKLGASSGRHDLRLNKSRIFRSVTWQAAFLAPPADGPFFIWKKLDQLHPSVVVPTWDAYHT
jgi:hypothetical protein